MNAITLGTPNLFVKGIAEQTFYDAATGNIVGYDKVASEGAIATSVNLPEITGGIGNPAIGVIPDTVRLTGTYTSQAFSLETRRLITGGKLTATGVASVCETVTAGTGGSLTVTRAPVKHLAQSAEDTYAWCYVKPHNATEYDGTNYGINMSTKAVVGYTGATAGQQYDVFYFMQNNSASTLALPDNFNPAVVSVQTKYGVYAMQSNNVAYGTLQGYLYVIVPRAILNGDAGVSANQTTNATTSGNWMALSGANNAMACADCGEAGSDLAYYVYVPCGATDRNIIGLATVGGDYTAPAEGFPYRMPVKFLMHDGSISEPDYSELVFAETTLGTGGLAIDDDGIISASGAGYGIVAIFTASYTASSGMTYTTSLKAKRTS